jgi:hypothetical protein
MNTPALPFGVRCIHSTSSTKFSYIRSVRSSQIGAPSSRWRRAFTLHVEMAQLMLCQPLRSVPLKSGAPAGSCCAPRCPATRSAARNKGAAFGRGGDSGAGFAGGRKRS